MTFKQKTKQESLTCVIISDGARKRDLKEIYLENIRLKEKLGLTPAGSDIESVAFTSLERLEKLHREQEDLNIGSKGRRKGKVLEASSDIENFASTSLERLKKLQREQKDLNIGSKGITKGKVLEASSDIENFASTSLERLEKLQREQKDLNIGSKGRTKGKVLEASSDIENFASTSLERLKKLQREQKDLNIGSKGRTKGKKWRTVALITLPIAIIVAVVLVFIIHKNTFSGPIGEKSLVASPLLQALPMEQDLVESLYGISQIQQPLRKYYFNVDYRAGSQTADCRYSVPNGIILIPDVSCITSFSSEVVEIKYEFSKSLAVSASESGDGWGVSFSASAGYKESSSVVATGESVFILSRAGSNYYYMRLLEDDAQPFHPVFLKWIIKLNTTDQETVYIEFYEKYGTHFLKEVKFGASFTYEHKMSASAYKTEKEKGVNVAVSVSYSGQFSVGGGFSMDSSQRKAASNFQKKVETRTITIGAAPPSNCDALTWASTVKESPVPVSYDLASIEELFTNTFMDSPKMQKFHID